MTTVVLDTNVISELVRLKPEPKVLSFLEACDDPIFSAIVFHEIDYGIERLRNVEKRTRLELFLRGIGEMYRGRIVQIGAGLAELAGRLSARASKSGWVLSHPDSLIAATAIESGARLAARNVRDFGRLPIVLVDPWAD